MKAFEQAISDINQYDVFRKNMFSVSMGSGPGTRIAQNITSNLISPLYTDSWIDKTLSSVGIGNQTALAFVNDISGQAITSAMKGSNARKILALANSEAVSSFMGNFVSGQAVLDFFAGTQQETPDVVAVKLPDRSSQHSYAINNYAGFSHQFGIPSPGYLTITFRQSPKHQLFQMFSDWYNLGFNYRGLAHLIESRLADITVTEHDRRGIPLLVHEFKNAVVTDIEGMDYSYESSNELQTFTVTFAFEHYRTGSMGAQSLMEWSEHFAGKIAGTVGESVGGLFGTSGSGLAAALGLGAGGGVNIHDKKFVTGGLLAGLNSAITRPIKL